MSEIVLGCLEHDVDERAKELLETLPDLSKTMALTTYRTGTLFRNIVIGYFPPRPEDELEGEYDANRSLEGGPEYQYQMCRTILRAFPKIVKNLAGVLWYLYKVRMRRLLSRFRWNSKHCE